MYNIHLFYNCFFSILLTIWKKRLINMDNIINRWRSVSKLYRLSLQRTAVGESAEENVYIEWASEGDRKGFDWVWKTERGLSVNKGRHMLVCKSGRLRASSGVAPQVFWNLSRQSSEIDCRDFLFWSFYVVFFNKLALSAAEVSSHIF